MNVEELVRLNNEKRKQLSVENLKYYEDMLVYIRLSIGRSEQETEEVLSELLDHLLEAQAQGKSAQDVFGDDPKKYADSIASELPRTRMKDGLIYAVMGLLYFFGVSTFIFGTSSFFFDGTSKSYYIGTLTVKVVFSILIVMVFMYMTLRLIRRLAFTKLNKAVEITLFSVIGCAAIGSFLVLYLLIPNFGPEVDIPSYVVALTGLALYGAAHFIQKKSI